VTAPAGLGSLVKEPKLPGEKDNDHGEVRQQASFEKALSRLTRAGAPKPCNDLPIGALKTTVSGIVMTFGRDALETGLVRREPAPVVFRYLWIRAERPL
jgi:hypothetical protein